MGVYWYDFSKWHRNSLSPYTVNTASPDANLVIDPKLAPPTQEQARLLRQVVLSGLGDHVARCAPSTPVAVWCVHVVWLPHCRKIATGHMSSEDKKRLRFSYQCVSCEGPVYLPTSSPFLTCPPEFLVFQELTDTSRIYMRGEESLLRPVTEELSAILSTQE